MKTKTIPMLIVAAAMICGNAQSQTNQAADADTAAAPAAPKVAEASPVPNTAEAAPLPPEASAPAAPVAPVVAAAPVEPVAPAVAAAPVEPAAPAAPAASNPEEQPILINPAATLPEAVQALARAAGINFLFDPKLISAQVGPDGRAVPAQAVGVEIRWEKVTPAQALTALLDNYGWQMIMDPKSKIYRITAKDPAALEPLVTTVIQLKYCNPTNVTAQLANTLSKRSTIVPDPRTSQLIVMTTERELISLQALIDKIDNATKQILIEAKLLETTKNPTSLRGVDWSGTLTEQKITYGNGLKTAIQSQNANGTKTTTGTAVNSGDGAINSVAGFAPSIAFLNASGLNAVLSFLNTDAETESLSLPRTVAQDGVFTELAVIRNVPIFEQDQSASANGGSLATSKAVYDKKVGDTLLSEVGIKLKVTPRIVGLTNVFMDLSPEISAKEVQSEIVILNNQKNEAPVFSRRKINTQATVPSGNTLVLGGLTSDNTSKIYNKVPILGDIPGLGLLFRHDSKSRTKQNLLIFVTPTIIQDTDYQATKTDFLKTKFSPPADVEESPMDTGKPKDWTKCKKTASADSK